MPFFKAWNCSRTVKKSVVVDSLEELLRKGREKLGLVDSCGEYKVFDEADGTEIDDDECLLSYEKGAVFIIGKEWRAAPQAEVAEVQTSIEYQSKENVSGMTDSTKGAVQCDEGSVHSSIGFEQLEIEKAWKYSDLADYVEDSIEETQVESYDVDEETEESHEFDREAKEKKKKKELKIEVGKKRPHETDMSSPTVSTQTSTVPEYPGFVKKGKNELSTEPASSSTTQSSGTQKTITEALMRANKYHNATLKKLKIYTDEEINAANSEMERKRRRFWNNKAEQVATSKKTANLKKTTQMGIIDVAWTLRKTAFIETDARKTLDEEKVLFRRCENEKVTKAVQKKETIPKNLDRMAAAHAAVEKADEELNDCRMNFEKARTEKERQAARQEFEVKQILMDGAYTELKKAQDATTKSVKAKRKELDQKLNVTESEEATTSTDIDG